MPGRVSDPYANDDDDDDVSGLVNEMNEHERSEQSGRRQAPPTGPSNRDDDYEFDTADTPEEFEVEVPRKRGAAPQDRDQRRQDRSGYREAYTGAREDNDRLRRELEIARQGPPPQEGDGADRAKEDYEQNLTSARTERARMLDTYNRGMTTGSLSEAAAGKMRDEAWELDQKIGKLNNDEWARQREPSENQRRSAALNVQLSTRAPDIYSNQTAHRLLMAKYQVLRSQGHKDSMELHDKACEQVRDEMGLRREEDRPEPTDRERAQLSGIPRGGSRGGRRGRGEAPRYKMNDNDRAMADVSHSYIKNPNKRYQTWVNEVRPDIE